MRLASAFAFVLLAACGTEDLSSQESLTRAPYECGDVEVHVIGVDGYNAVDPGGTTTGSDDGSTVLLRRPGHHILVLSSRLANTWNVQVQGDAILDGVYAVGHEPQKVVTNVRTKIKTESGMTGGADVFGYKYPSSGTTALLELTSTRVARHATSFHGCKSASRWVIGEDMLTTSDCEGVTYTQFDAVLDCDGDNACDGNDGSDGDSGDGSLF